MKNKALYIISLILLVFSVSCRKDINKPQWDSDMLLPLLKSSMDINDIVEDSIKKVNSDNSISLIYENEIFSFNVDTMLAIPDTSVDYSANINSININDINIEVSKSLGDIANYDLEENGPTGGLYELIMNAHNSGTPTEVSSIEQQTYDDIDLDATDYFYSLTLQQGFIDIRIINDIPVDFTNVTMELKDEISGDIIVQDTFPIIYANSTTSTHTHSLAGKTVPGNLQGFIQFESPGSNGDVVLDTVMDITAEITVRDLIIDSAEAIFPSQNLVDTGETANFTIDDIRLKEAVVKSGNINIDIYNTIAEPLNYYFEIPSATKNGSKLIVSGTVPASSGSVSHSSIQRNISGYYLNLRGIGPIEQLSGDLNNNGFIDNDTVNTIYYSVAGSIDSSGNIISLSKNDSIYVSLSFSEIVPEYAEGWLGQQVISVTGDDNMDTFDDILDGSIDLEEVKLSVCLSNEIGAYCDVFINSLNTVNTGTNNSTSLIIPSQYYPLNVNKPVNPYSTAAQIIPEISNMDINSNNSNPDEVIEIMPDKFEYSVDLKINNNISPPPIGSGTDFLYYGSKAVAYLNAEIPLSLIAENITLIDTADFKLNEKDVENIIGGNLILYAYNYFPIAAESDLILIDESENIIDTLLKGEIIKEAYVESSSGKVQESTKTKIKIPVYDDRLTDLVNTKKIKIITRFTTKPNNSFVKIYNSYTVDFSIVGDFKYHFE